MHIEPGVVSGAKMLLSYATATVSFGYLAKEVIKNIKEYKLLSLVIKSVVSIIVVFSCFEILPHYPVGVSEVHLILGTTIYLLFGLAPAMIGLAMGLLIQGIFFAPFDLPQFGINVTTLLASMIVLDLVAKKVIPKDLAYKDISYFQMLKLSIAWEGAIVSWVAFWAFYGQGFGSENITNVASFMVSYMSVVIIEPLIDLSVLAFVKAMDNKCNILLDKRVNNCIASIK
jgi:ABC-type Co2+ transport system permease subunit